jgi:hypothetical protein
MPSKYDRLRDYLISNGLRRREIALRFDEIETLIGADLPPSAYKYREWWSNQSDVSNRPQAKAWIEAGFKVDSVQQHNGRRVVRFTRQ